MKVENPSREFLMEPAKQQHVYELRLYQVNEGKMDALIARFGDHTDAIFKRHNMKSVGFWRPQDAPFSENMFVYILEHPSRDDARKNWAAFQADPEWKKVKVGIGNQWTIGEAHRQLLHGSDQLFSAQVECRRKRIAEGVRRALASASKERKPGWRAKTGASAG